MCGRYLLEDEAYADILLILHNLNKAKKSAASALAQNEFASGEQISRKLAKDGLASGDIFPTSIAPIGTSDGIVAVKWGFPHWKNSGVIINARSETASIKKMFAKPLRERRCVVPSSGFYEWSRQVGKSKTKNKYFLHQPGESVLYMAAITDTFRDAQGTQYSAFVILTTAANDSVSPIHDRMPVILAPDELELWINDDNFTEQALHRTGPELVAVLST